ncbi:pyridoxal phosphate-dependent transferase [Crepidotus variabilis]|uniref:Pyridoxal phosphate-dependent transferase n=1 Tax=Crepidotus variabilis TaxID=179855 RepID=A0A9P6EAZ2_9AGAR|nr:pyridoxal phosphate-dependent transferase [Crepidotus variabilis]
MDSTKGSTALPRSALETRLHTALVSREQRWIKRRLPDTNTSPSSAGSLLIDFNSNDYLSLSQSSTLRSLFLERLAKEPDILGSGGSRLLVNGRAHAALETRLAKFFRSETALLFNSGFDANVGFFSCIPQAGDAVVYDEYIHASVHDGVRASRVAKDMQFAFKHNSIPNLKAVLLQLKRHHGGLRTGETSLFLAVESLYSMDGTFAPLIEIADLLDDLFPAKNAYFVVDEAHSTGIYGIQGRGRVSLMGLESRVFARLHTFGKALAASGAVVLTNALVHDYLLNYARSLIYTTALSYANIIAADCSFDMLDNGTAQHLSSNLLQLSSYFSSTLQERLTSRRIPSSLVSLSPHLTSTQLIPSLDLSSQLHDASPIVPILTPHPRPLSSYLLALGMNARPITWPTVPKGKDRVRVCLHAGNSKDEVDRLVSGVIKWAEETMRTSLPGYPAADNLPTQISTSVHSQRNEDTCFRVYDGDFQSKL